MIINTGNNKRPVNHTSDAGSCAFPIKNIVNFLNRQRPQKRNWKKAKRPRRVLRKLRHALNLQGSEIAPAFNEGAVIAFPYE